MSRHAARPFGSSGGVTFRQEAVMIPGALTGRTLAHYLVVDELGRGGRAVAKETIR
jgi:hypothetical protein